MKPWTDLRALAVAIEQTKSRDEQLRLPFPLPVPGPTYPANDAHIPLHVQAEGARAVVRAVVAVIERGRP
jgi:hypothetical protein